MDSLKLLKQAEEAGLKVSYDGDKLRIRGPKTAESIAKALSQNKVDIIEILSNRFDTDDDRVESMRERLRKGVSWFLAVDSSLWNSDGHPINIGSKVEAMLTKSLAKWGEEERLLRNLYDYDGCIYDSGNVPTSLPSSAVDADSITRPPPVRLTLIVRHITTPYLKYVTNRKKKLLRMYWNRVSLTILLTGHTSLSHGVPRTNETGI